YLAGNYEAAMEAMQRAIRLDPHFALAHDHTGEMYLHTGELDKAIVAFHTEMRINGDVIYPYFYLVWIHSLMGEFGIAGEILEKAKLKHGKNPLLFVLRGTFASYHGDLQEAEQNLQRAISMNPNNSFASGRLAVVFADQQRWKEAIQTAETATERIDPLDHH